MTSTHPRPPRLVKDFAQYGKNYLLSNHHYYHTSISYTLFLYNNHQATINKHGRHHPFSPLRRQACRCHTSICQARPAIKLPLHRIESRWQGELATLVSPAFHSSSSSPVLQSHLQQHCIDNGKCLTFVHRRSTSLHANCSMHG